MNKFVPLISSRLTGPLGIAHLPRLWQKMLLAAKGRLNDDYKSGIGGLDGWLLDTLGLEYEATATFFSEASPTYLDFEAWIKEHAPAEKLTSEAIHTFNQEVLAFHKPEPERTEMLKRAGLPTDDTIWCAVDLNDQDDWVGFHQEIVKES